jgi:hypothetical protein
LKTDEDDRKEDSALEWSDFNQLSGSINLN